MVYTNFPNGITSFGMPVIGSGGFPPFTGNYFFCDYVNGSDGGLGTADDPFKTLAFAYSKTASGNNDVIFIVGDGSTAETQRLSASLTWANNATHLIGLTAPVPIASRARISHLTTATVNINPLMTVSGSGCIFANFSFFQGVGQSATDEKLIVVSGSRNYFSRIHFGGMGAAAGAARAGSYIMSLTGSENLFEECALGVDTVARSAANANIICSGGAARNTFLKCYFPILASAATPIVVDTSAVASIDRFLLLKECFINNAVNSTGTAMTAATAYSASQGGTVVYDNCTLVGITDYANPNTATVKVSGAIPGGHTSGIAASAATS